MTPQEIFDRVATHLYTQGRRSAECREDGTVRCLYRAPNGDKCAVGCLIPDDEYDPGMEGTTFAGLVKRYPSLARLEAHTDLLTALQDVHDYREFHCWPDRLRLCARAYNLSDDIITKLWGEA